MNRYIEDNSILVSHVNYCYGVREIDTDAAKAIASKWHGGQATMLYTVSCSGYVPNVQYVLDEIADARKASLPIGYDSIELDMLATWVMNVGVHTPYPYSTVKEGE